MNIVRAASVMTLLLMLAGRASAQVSCADPDNLCTGDPCTTTNIEVEANCVIDFGNRALVIGGALEVPTGGTLSFTASSILVQGRIEASGAAVTLVADMGPADLRTEIDVGVGSLDVSATGNIDVKQRLKAKPGGSITLAADGALETKVAAVIEVDDGGSVAISGDLGVIIGGRIFAGGLQSGSVQITSSAGLVTLNQEVRASGDPPSTITLDGASGVVMNHSVQAVGHSGPGGALTIISSGGDVVMHKVRVKGMDGGSVAITAPLGEVDPIGIDAKGKINGGSVTIDAATVMVRKGIDAEGGLGNGGTISLTGSAVVTVAAQLEVQSKMNGGVIGLFGGPASGNVLVTRGLKAAGGAGDGGLVMVSTPAGTVTIVKSTIDVVSKGGLGGGVFVDGDGLTIGPKTRVDADGQTLGGEIRFSQSGAGTFLLSVTGLEARDDGTIEALAPAGTLTVSGRLSAGPAGCIGLSAATLNAGGASPDVPVTLTCP